MPTSGVNYVFTSLCIEALHSYVGGPQQPIFWLAKIIETLEDKLAIFTGLNNDLKADKENLQKQLELVTLRLPPQSWFLG